jgi:hypothetical protein
VFAATAGSASTATETDTVVETKTNVVGGWSRAVGAGSGSKTRGATWRRILSKSTLTFQGLAPAQPWDVFAATAGSATTATETRTDTVFGVMGVLLQEAKELLEIDAVRGVEER